MGAKGARVDEKKSRVNIEPLLACDAGLGTAAMQVMMMQQQLAMGNLPPQQAQMVQQSIMQVC
jgi:hypothetical protein